MTALLIKDSRRQLSICMASRDYYKPKIMKKCEEILINLKPNLNEISKSLGGTPRGSEDIIDSGELQDLLGNPSGNDSGTTRGRDHADGDGTALSGDLAGNGVWLPDLITPVAPPNGNNG